jgi:hypothetical protein
MNGNTHASYSDTVARLVCDHGFAPQAREILLRDDCRREFVGCSTMPDRVSEVSMISPATTPKTEICGHGLASFEHFQIDGRGYSFRRDQSLGPLSEIGSILSEMVLVKVALSTGGTPPPMSGLLDPSPFAEAFATQPDRDLGDFVFPSAARSAEYWVKAARYWLAEKNLVGFARCAGYMLHFVQDCHVPHHTWGVLLDGHTTWENQLEFEWDQISKEICEANMIESYLTRALSSDLVVYSGLGPGDCCERATSWVTAVFGGRRSLGECPGDVAMRVSVRALAASLVSLKSLF